MTFALPLAGQRLTLAVITLLTLPSLAAAQSPRDHEDAVASVVKELDNKIQEEGALLHPFRLKYTADVKSMGWHEAQKTGDSGHGLFTEWKVNGSGEFLPLGDTLTWLDPEHYAHPERGEPVGALLFAPALDAPDALRHPVDFVKTNYSGGTNSTKTVHHWIPVPPEGYRAVGLCFSKSEKPDPNGYWCVHERYLRKISAEVILTEYGKLGGWATVLGEELQTPTFKDGDDRFAPPGKMLFLPPTYVSLDSTAIKEGMSSYALIMDQLVLTTELMAAEDPKDLPNPRDGKRGAPGLDSEIAVIPSIPSLEKPLDLRRIKTGFQYITSEPYYKCLETYRGLAQTEMEQQYSLGTNKAKSNTFTKSTSLTVSAETGMEYGGFSAKISASYTSSFGLSTSQSSSVNETNQQKKTLTLKKADRAFIWQNVRTFYVRRGDGEPISMIDYETDDLVVTYAGVK